MNDDSSGGSRASGERVRKALAVGSVFLASVAACSHHDAAGRAVTHEVTATQAPAAPSERPDAAPAADFAPVSKLINDAIAANRLPGAVVVVGHGGTIAFHQAYGSRKLAGEPGLDGSPAPAEPMTEDTIFDLASLTKILATATAVMQLYEQGRVQFDDPVQRYLPDFNPGNEPRRAKVTVRMLLTHTSGETGDVNLGDPWGLDKPDKAEGVRRALTTPLESTPGQGFRYSDINFILLGALVEKITGEALDAYVQQHVFDPLGMADTRYLPPADACGPHTTIGAAIAWAPALAGPRSGCLSRGHLERRSPVAHSAHGARRRGPGRSGQESRSRSPAPRHRAGHDGAADGRSGRACRRVLDRT